MQRLTFGVLLFDAAGLGLFTVTGTLKALDHGFRPAQSAVLGVTTGVGGGLLRDIIARQAPALVRVDTDLYAIPAMLGAAAVTAADRMNLRWPGAHVMEGSRRSTPGHSLRHDVDHLGYAEVPGHAMPLS